MTQHLCHFSDPLKLLCLPHTVTSLDLPQGLCPYSSTMPSIISPRNLQDLHFCSILISLNVIFYRVVLKLSKFATSPSLPPIFWNLFTLLNFSAQLLTLTYYRFTFNIRIEFRSQFSTSSNAQLCSRSHFKSGQILNVSFTLLVSS